MNGHYWSHIAFPFTVMAHASLSELTPKELVEELKAIYSALNTFQDRGILEELTSSQELEAVKEAVKKPPIPLNQIVKENYVVCLECGRKMRTLKAHLRKAHQLMPKDYYQRYNLDPKKFPLVCKEYSEKRRQLAIDKGLWNLRKREASQQNNWQEGF